MVRTEILHAVRLARVDLRLLGRNQTALFNAMLMPLLLGFMFGMGAEGPQGLFVLTGLPGMMLVFAVFLNLVSSFTSRREELVLKRLLGGQPSPVAIMGGAGLGALAVYAVQLAVLAVWIHHKTGELPVNVPLMIVAAVLGVAVFEPLAAAFSGISRNAELAQLAVTPVILLALFVSPVMVPLGDMPTPMRVAAEILPSTPIVGLMRMAYSGVTPNGDKVDIVHQWLAALPSFGALVAWLIVATLLARWLFRWDPRRG
ncbi:ABC transporter permease [Thermoactinospora rubra]|uniref:ABC transporter permease n=1 Tax=Thermoactinospora rubra TaxID=1088767 RepID=UPI00197D9A21|nr:ABC transporter permease [Thermoactinospora rubra]